MIYQKKIESLSFFSAFFFHLLALFLIFAGPSTLEVPQKKIASKVFVQTVQLKQSIVEHSISPSSSSPLEIASPPPGHLIATAPSPLPAKKIEKESIPIKEKKPVQKTKAPPQKKEKTAPVVTQKKTAPVPEQKKEAQRELEKKQALLQEKLAFLSSSRKEMETGKNAPSPKPASSLKKIESLQIDTLRIEEVGISSSWGAPEMNYRQRIADQLKKSLKLQEKGAVKIQCTINSQGKIVGQEILSSESKKNLEYIQQMLPHLKFPPFDPHLFDGASTYTILIILDNA